MTDEEKNQIASEATTGFLGWPRELGEEEWDALHDIIESVIEKVIEKASLTELFCPHCDQRLKLRAAHASEPWTTEKVHEMLWHHGDDLAGIANQINASIEHSADTKRLEIFRRCWPKVHKAIRSDIMIAEAAEEIYELSQLYAAMRKDE